MSPTMTPAQVEEMLHVSPRTRRRLRAEGLRPTKRGLYARKTVERFAADKTTSDARQRASQTALARALAGEQEQRLAVLEVGHMTVDRAREAGELVRTITTQRLSGVPAELAPLILVSPSAADVDTVIRAHLRQALIDLAGRGGEAPRPRPRRAPRGGQTLEEERARLADVKAKLASFRTALHRGELLPVQDVHDRLGRRVHAVRTALLSLGPRMAPRLHALAQRADEVAVRAALEQAITEAASELKGDPFP